MTMRRTLAVLALLATVVAGCSSGTTENADGGTSTSTKTTTGRTEAVRFAECMREHGAEYGLCQIYANEPWHYELRPDAGARGCPPIYADPTHDPRMQQ